MVEWDDCETRMDGFAIRGSHWLSVVLNVTGRRLYGVLAFLERDCDALMDAD